MRYPIFLLLILISTSILAVPARRVKKTIQLPDGSIKRVELRGDEFSHYLQDEEGCLYREDDALGYRRVQKREVEQQWQARSQRRNDIRRQKSPMTRSQSGGITFPLKAASQGFKGKKKGLVILVSFTDRKLTHTQAEFNDYFNLSGYSSYNMGGSVHDYFYDCSYGQFDLTFDVIGPVTVNHNMAYYGKNDTSGDDIHPAEMVGEAILQADKLGVNFSDYDWDNDGEVDQVYVIYAGYGESSGAPSQTIWPHEYDLYSAAYYGDGPGVLHLDGVDINTYACSNELYGTSGNKLDGIGTACHEFSHCLGIPDMYDTTGRSFGMSDWDLMDYGCYHNDGFTPCGYTSYERWVSGWLDPIVLDQGCDITDMPSLDSAPVAYIIYNQRNNNEYYLLENRQQVGWHTYDYGHGLLILHVDYNREAWENNTVNNTSSHQRMTIIPADNKLSDTYESDLAGDTWPGTVGKTSLTNTTTPAATLYNANSDGTKFMNAPIEHIAEDVRRGTISFSFMGGDPLGIPSHLQTKSLTPTGFTVSWDPVPAADGYELELTSTHIGGNEVTDERLIFYEDFSGFADASSSVTDLSDVLDKYTLTSGWSGAKVFCTADEEVKIGTSKVAGSITTPLVQPRQPYSTVFFTLRPYGSDQTEFNIKLDNTTRGPIMLDEASTFRLTVNDSDPYRFTIQAANSSQCRFYLSELKIYDGDVQNDVKAQIPASIPPCLPQKVKTQGSYTTTTSEYSFTDLDPNYLYSLRVRSLQGEKRSGWSESILVQLPATDNLSAPPSGSGSDERYTLDGIRITGSQHPAKGLVIRQGHKYIVK